MANPLVRSVSFFAGTKKVSQADNTRYRGTDNGEPVYGDVPGGFITFTEGSVEGTLTVTEIIPVAGSDYDFVSAVTNHTPLDLALSLVDGKIHQLPSWRCMEFEFEGEVKSGVLKGTFTFKGGRPTVTG